MKLLLTAFVSILALGQAAMANNITKLLQIGHKLNHPFGSHMHLHNCKLLAKCLTKSRRQSYRIQ